MKRLLITGGTGSFGKHLVKNLLNSKPQITLLVRSESQEKALDRAKSIFGDSINFEDGSQVLRADLTKKDLGLTKDQYKHLTEGITHILHVAASTRFNLPIEEARTNNVETTRVMLNCAKNCKKLVRFGFVSTAFVAGKRSGLILEDEFEHQKGFLNTYEQSKYEAEMLVRSEKEKLPITIFRPSLIITPFRKSGKNPINALTLGIFLVRKGFLPILPGNEESTLDIIDVSQSSGAVSDLFLKDKLKFLTYHITSSQNSPNMKAFIKLVEGNTGKKLNIRFCGGMENFKEELKRTVRFRPDLALFYKKTETFLPELAYPKIFDNSNLKDDLGVKEFSEKPTEGIYPLLN